jgi:hypothetical protein
MWRALTYDCSLPQSDMVKSKYLYHVLRHTVQEFGEGTEIQGVYWSLEEANQAARTNLTDEWDLSFFDEYTEEEDEDDGSVVIEATCPEGETMRVYIEKILGEQCSFSTCEFFLLILL